MEKRPHKALILITLGTGLRQGELLALQWDDIVDNQITINKTVKQVTEIDKDGKREYKTIVQTPKSKNSVRKVPLPASLIPVLEAHKTK